MKNTNIHHTLWTRANYAKATYPHLLREHPFLKHEMLIARHNDLHADIDPLPRMSVDLAKISLRFFDDYNMTPTYERRVRLDAFDMLTEYYFEIGQMIGRLATEAGGFAEHFVAQRGYINNGK